jgi:hypothetical protein
MRIRTTAAAVILAAATTVSVAGLAYAQPGGDANCSDFPSQQAAQASLDAQGGDDPDGLDTDEDGRACDDFDYSAAGDGNDDDNNDNDNNDDNDNNGNATATPTPAPPAQVSPAPNGGVDTGDGSTGDILPGLLVLSGLTTVGAGAGALALRRSARRSD